MQIRFYMMKFTHSVIKNCHTNKIGHQKQPGTYCTNANLEILYS